MTFKLSSPLKFSIWRGVVALKVGECMKSATPSFRREPSSLLTEKRGDNWLHSYVKFVNASPLYNHFHGAAFMVKET